jgi:hypothetical protein
MSSVTRFIRQVPVSTTYYNAATVVGTPATYVYEFVPSGSNYVGNYPTFLSTAGGWMQTASAELIAALAQAVNAAGGAGNLVLRDMGKTIFAPTSSAGTAFSYFRQVQLLDPNTISSTQLFNGGTAGSTFGVLGGNNIPDAFTDFLTFYIPVNVAGVGLPAASASQAFALAGGQM